MVRRRVPTGRAVSHGLLSSRVPPALRHRTATPRSSNRRRRGRVTRSDPSPVSRAGRKAVPRASPRTATPPARTVPDSPPPTPPKRRGKVLIIVGALVLALIVGAIAVALLNRDDPVASQPPATASQDPSGAATTAPPTSAPPPAAKASDAVVGYLEALAAGSASAALSYAVDPVAAGPLLTDQVLAQSRKRAPLSGIEVPPVDDEQATTVTAAYTLGKTAVNTDLRRGQGRRRVEAGRGREAGGRRAEPGQVRPHVGQRGQGERQHRQRAARVVRVQHRPVHPQLRRQERRAGQRTRPTTSTRTR